MKLRALLATMTPAQIKAARIWLSEITFRNVDPDWVLIEATDMEIVCEIVISYPNRSDGFLKDFEAGELAAA